MAIEAFLAHWGIAAVFVGAMAEGESFVIGGGALAQQGLLVVWQVALAAFAGSVAMDQLCFWIGRRMSGHAFVQAIRRQAACKRAIDFVERHPTGYILSFRYLYGLRIVSPVAIGLTSVPAARFLALNAASAAVWAVLFTGIGYAAGHAYTRVFGEVHSVLILLLGVVVLATISLAVAHRFLKKAT